MKCKQTLYIEFGVLEKPHSCVRHQINLSS